MRREGGRREGRTEGAEREGWRERQPEERGLRSQQQHRPVDYRFEDSMCKVKKRSASVTTLHIPGKVLQASVCARAYLRCAHVRRSLLSVIGLFYGALLACIPDGNGHALREVMCRESDGCQHPQSQ